MSQPADNRAVSACYGKHPFATATHAHEVKRRMLRSKAHYAEKGRQLAVYRCAFCTQWHVGNEWA